MSDEEEGAKRRKRTAGYMKIWGIQAELGDSGIPVASTAILRSPAEIVGRSKALCLVALKGQGLSQHEVFAFADAYEVWGHLSVEENEFVLDPNPEPGVNINFAWRSEGLWVAEFALGLVRHLGFPDTSIDPARAVKICIEEICAKDAPSLRPMKELLDAADVAKNLWKIASALTDLGEPMPSGLVPGIAFERNVVFDWLLSKAET